MKKSYLICFTGVDGSGKTTHAKSLLEYLETKGFACKYVWGASRPITSYAFLLFTRLLGYWKETKKNVYTDPLEYAPKELAKKLGRLWRLFVFVDFQIKTLVKTRPYLALGKIVVLDRYFYDLLMDLDVSKISSEEFIRRISETLPRPQITFLLDAPPSLTAQRRGFSLQDLQAKRETFLKMGQRFQFHIVDSSEDFNVNQQRIRDLTVAKIGKNSS